MAKRFDIHEWQAKQQLKQWLTEQDDFTPDLEDDDLKRSKIQQMMAKEKESEYELSDEEKDSLTDMTNEFVRKLTDVRGGNYSGDKLLAALQHVTLEIENLEPMIYDDEDEDGIPDVVDNNEEELEKDVRKIEDHPMLDKVNTKDEWEDLVQIVLDMGDEIKSVTPAIMKATLIDAIKNLNKPQ